MNKLRGKISEIQSSENMSIVFVEVNEDRFSAFVLGGRNGSEEYRIGDSVTLLFKETEVGIAKNLTGAISFRNRFKAEIKKVDKGPILTRLKLCYRHHPLESIISTQSAISMELKEKEEIEWLVKTNEMTLMKNPS